MLLHVAYMSDSRTTLGYDDETSYNLGILAEAEDRSKFDEVRYLIKQRLKEIGLAWKEVPQK
jgi:hypothetical protein